jgi:hypothetical protein
MYGSSIALRQQLKTIRLLSDATSMQNATILKIIAVFASQLSK